MKHNVEVNKKDIKVVANSKFKPSTMRYYGGKTKLLDFIICNLKEAGLEKGMKVLDGFSGTSVVAQRFKYEGFITHANDNLFFCYCIADAHMHFRKSPTFKNLNFDVFTHLNSLKGKSGFITKNYTPFRNSKRMYVTTNNGKKIDAVRDRIEDWYISNKINKHEYNYLITSLIYAINLVSNVTGTYGAYLKIWDSRAKKDLILKPLNVISSKNKNKAFNSDIKKILKKNSYDAIYLDPPYNSRNYYSNYFFLELIARGWYIGKLEINGISGNVNNYKVESELSSKRFAEDEFKKIISLCNSKILAVSYNDEGILSDEKIMEILLSYGSVEKKEMTHKRYRSINQDGTNNKTSEVLYIARKNNG